MEHCAAFMQILLQSTALMMGLLESPPPLVESSWIDDSRGRESGIRECTDDERPKPITSSHMRHNLQSDPLVLQSPVTADIKT